MINTVLCTTGTSLIEGNLRNINNLKINRPDNIESIERFFKESNWTLLAKELLKLEPTNRICGAEINTIAETNNKSWISLDNLVLLVSDTEAGRNTGTLIKKYFELSDKFDFKNIDFKVIEHLQDENPKDFKTKGLRNLVRTIGEYVQRYGRDSIVIDATGGYKAQIAIAVIVGQALDIPVLYKHERFSEVIDFPPLPITLDYDILGRNADILNDFERGKAYSENEIPEFEEKLKVFLTEVEIDGHTVYELNAIGQLYLTSFRLRNPKVAKLVELEDNLRENPTFGNDHHFPDDFKSFVIKVHRDNKWIKTCYSTSFHGQRAIKGISFSVKHLEEGKLRLVGTFQDRNNFGARFDIILSENSNQSLNWAADYLNNKYR